MMNKKEQAAMDELRKQLLLAKALRWTSKVNPDVPIPNGSYGQILSKGWLYNAYLGGPRVDVACTNSVHHAFGDNTKTTSQNPRELYSTKVLALKALRHEIEKQCASILAGIDLQIEQEESK